MIHYKNINFIKSNFGASRPDFSKDSVDYGVIDTFATKIQPFNLESIQPQIVKVTIESVSSNVDFASICFLSGDANGVAYVSVNDGLVSWTSSLAADQLYSWSMIEYVIKNGTDDRSGHLSFYVRINDDNSPKSNFLNIHVAVGKNGTPPDSSNVRIGYECQNPIVEGNFGVHAYSSYDAYYNPKVSTTLRSIQGIAIEEWTIGTKVYHAVNGQQIPALPYYYSYGDKVFKVGGNFDRAYGYVSKFRVREDRTIVTNYKHWMEIRRGEDIQDFHDENTETSPSCVVPLRIDEGIITEVINYGDLVMPQVYRYFMGYHLTDKLYTNDHFFKIFNPTFSTEEAGIGFTHMTHRWGVVPLVYVNPADITGLLTSVFSGGIVTGIVGSSAGAVILQVLPNWTVEWFYWVGESMSFTAGNLSVGETIFAWGPWIAAFFIALYIFTPEYGWVKEECDVDFLHHFTDTPYIEENHILYRDTGLTEHHVGYYCDGGYFYYQNGTPEIISKEYVCSASIDMTHGFSGPGMNYVTTLQCSPIADNGYTDDYLKLCFLSYVSGDPIPPIAGFYNVEQIGSASTIGCCDFQVCKTIEITIPANTFFSTLSQDDANNMSIAELNRRISDFETGEDVECLNGKGASAEINSFIANFTHELKIETNPTEVLVYYDIRVNDEPIIGTILYYDECGCTKSLNGYYSVFPVVPYCRFYHVTNGIIDGIYEMANVSDITTTTSEPIIQTNRDYSSNWYFSNHLKYYLDFYTSSIFGNRNYDTLQIYDNPDYESLPDWIKLKKGFLKTPQVINNFQVFDNFSTNIYHEAVNKWYFPLIPWNPEPVYDEITDKFLTGSFFYDFNRTITLYTQYDCQFADGITKTRGFYIIGKYNGDLIALGNTINLTVKVYTLNDELTATYIIEPSRSALSSFFIFDTQVGETEEITNIVIESINSTNPVGTVTYEIGGYLGCKCDLSLDFITTDTTAIVTVSNGFPNYNYFWSNGYAQYGIPTPVGLASGLSTGITYNVNVVDGVNCSKTEYFRLGQKISSFDADYIVLTYGFTSGADLETRTRIVTPDVGQISQSNYLGRDRETNWPTLGNYVIKWGGDAGGSSYESVLIDIITFRSLYPTASQLIVDCRGYWYGSASVDPVVISVTLYKGGEMVIGAPSYGFSNPTASITSGTTFNDKVISLSTTDPNTSGERIGTFTYDLSDYKITSDIYDNSTPSV